MIKFFRRIRQQLLAQNRFSKYMLYAFGEIVLVVIGILIALQLNNWNENRKQKIIEIQLLKDLQTTLSRDSISINGVLGLNKRKLQYLKLIKRELNNGKIENDSMNTAFSFALQVNTFMPKIGPYEVLKSKGFSLISNDSLRAQIIDLYEGSYSWVKKGQEDKFINENFFKEYSLRHFNNIVYADRIQPKRHYYREIIPHDFMALSKDSVYLTLINSKIAQEEYVITYIHGNALIKINNLLSFIESELIKYSKN
jgi:hypothetical protein